MGYWWSVHARFDFDVDDWRDIGKLSASKLSSIVGVPMGDFQYAEGGVHIGLQFNGYRDKVVVSFDLRDEGGHGDNDVLYWFLLACEASRPSHAVYRLVDDWDGERVRCWPILPDDFDWSEVCRELHDLDVQLRASRENEED